MTSPTDIPNFGGGSGGSGGPAGGPSGNGASSPASGDEVRNDAVRAAIEAVAAEAAGSGPAGTATTVDVLRHCLFGYLLLDITGSELELTDTGEIAEGSTINVRGGEGPDGGPAIFAFTSQEQLAQMYPDGGAAEGVQVQSLIQEAAGVLELVQQQDVRWLCLDPAGPSVALSADDLEFALRVPRNYLVRATLEPGVERSRLLAALQADGPLSLAVDAPDLEPGVSESNTQVQVRTTDSPDGNGQALAVFTSGPEVVARAPEDKIATQSAAEVLALARDGGFGGMVINPAGPWAFVPATELQGL